MGILNALVLFARYLIKNDLILNLICPTLKLCITTSEVLTFEDRKILNSAFGVIVVNEYGISEAGGITAFENGYFDWILSAKHNLLKLLMMMDQY